MKSYILAACAVALMAGCESSPYEKRQTTAVRPPVTGSYSAERETLQDDSMEMSFLRIEGPKDKNDTIHFKPLGADGLDFFPSKPSPNAGLKPIEVPSGTINLQPTGTPPPAKP